MSRSISVFALFFAAYTAAVFFLLVLGLAGALAEVVIPLRLQLEMLAQRGDALAPLASAMHSASETTTPAAQIVLDYAVSTLNLGFGLFLVRRLPGQLVARVLGLGMVGAATSFNAHAHSALLSSSLLYSVALNNLHLALHVLSGAAYLYALLLFPDGTLVPRGADWILGGIVAVAVGSILVFHTDVLFFVVYFGFLIPIVGMASLAYRRTLTTDARARQQIGVVAWALGLALLAAVIFLLLVFGPQVVGRPDVVQATPQAVEYVALELFSILFAIVPIALFVGILRYQLFDIRIIARTLAYGTLTATIVGLYVLIVGALDVLFGTGNSLVVSLVATGSIAVAFQPLRERLQRGANRWIYGERDEPYRVLSRLGRRLEATLVPEAVLPTIVQTVREALKLPYTAIVLQGTSGPALAAVSGTVSGTPLRLRLTYQHEPMGALLLGPRSPGEEFTRRDQRLLGDLARQAGAAAHAVRLTADLQRARERLVSAREEERRRLRRDLHDGLGPALAGQVLRAGTARRVLARDPVATDALLAQLEIDLGAALAELRRVVYDLRPPALDELGLVAAIQASAGRLSSPRIAEETNGALAIVVEAPAEDLPPLPAAVEVAAYRIVEEALTNVVRHAHARACRVRLDLEDGLRLEIVDDGVGLEAVGHRAGVGLTSMRERADELGGSCRVETLPGGGTRVLARLPQAVSAKDWPPTDDDWMREREGSAHAS